MFERMKPWWVLATLVSLACGAESEAPPPDAATETNAVAPAPPPPPTPPTPPGPTAAEVMDCDRGRATQGFLAHLPEHRLEQTDDYREIESALLSFGRVTVVYSGCLQYIRECRFEVEEPLLDADDVDVFRRAADLMQALAVAVDSGAAANAAREIEELSAPGAFSMGEDLTGGMFEGDYGIGVEVTSDGEGGATLVVLQVVKL